MNQQNQREIKFKNKKINKMKIHPKNKMKIFQ